MVKGEGKFSYQRLEVWQDAMKLSRLIYKITRNFPKDEQYGIVSQLRRAAVSIPVNTAEGRGRFSKKEQIQFFYNARGSLYEAATLLELSIELGYLDKESCSESEALALRILGKLSGLINSPKGLHPSPFTLHPSPSP